MIEGRTDVLIVGAGPGGSAAAVVAARAGASVCLVDRATFPRQKTCGDAISNSAYEIAEELAGTETAERVPRGVVRGAAAVFPDGTRVRRSYGGSPGYIVERDDFDDLLRRAAERAGARVLEGVTVRRLVWDGARVVGAEGSDVRLRASVTIVADGTASLAWNALGLAPPEPTALGVSMTAYYRGIAGIGEESEHYFEKFLPTGYGWIFPEVEGRSNVGVYLRVDRYRKSDARLGDLLDAFLARHPERFAGATPDGVRRSSSLPLASFGRVPAAPGLLVVGDAARLIDPLTGEGIWHALESGRIAGRCAVEALGVTNAVDTLPARYRREVERAVLWPTAFRRALEATTTFIVEHDLYRSALVRRTLEWGYGRKALEIAKSTAP